VNAQKVFSFFISCIWQKIEEQINKIEEAKNATQKRNFNKNKMYNNKYTKNEKHTI
jgi:hypothetical protein